MSIDIGKDKFDKECEAFAKKFYEENTIPIDDPIVIWYKFKTELYKHLYKVRKHIRGLKGFNIYCDETTNSQFIRNDTQIGYVVFAIFFDGENVEIYNQYNTTPKASDLVLSIVAP